MHDDLYVFLRRACFSARFSVVEYAEALLIVETVDNFTNCDEFGHQGLEVVEVEHVCAVAFGVGGVEVGFDEDAVDADGDAGFGDGFDHVWAASGYSGCLVWLLEGVGDVEDGGGELLHGWDAAEVDNHVLVAEHGAAVCEHDALVVAVEDFLDGVLHAFGAHELAFFEVDDFAGVCRCYYEVCLADEEGWDL